MSVIWIARGLILLCQLGSRPLAESVDQFCYLVKSLGSPARHHIYKQGSVGASSVSLTYLST